MANAFDWNTDPASNNAAPPDGAPEDMRPSAVNNTMRQMMANVAGAFTVYTAGGTANAQTVTMDPALTAYSKVVRIAFVPVADNTGACTLNVNGLGAKSIKLQGGAGIYAGALQDDYIALVQYDGTNFILLNPAEVSGSFTLTGTGFSGTAPSVTCAYKRNGSVVTLKIDSFATFRGTSNSTSFGGSGVPTAIRPSTTSGVQYAHLRDNGSNIEGSMAVGSDGTITFYNGVSPTGFTSSGEKGLGNRLEVTYSI